MKQFPIFRGSRVIRFAGTLLTVSLLVTLRVETPAAIARRSTCGTMSAAVRLITH